MDCVLEVLVCACDVEDACCVDVWCVEVVVEQ